MIKEPRSPGDSEAPKYEQQWEASCTPTAVGMMRMSVVWDTKVAWWRLVPLWRCSHCHRCPRKEKEMEGNTLVSSLLLSPVLLPMPPVGQIYLETREQWSLGSVVSDTEYGEGLGVDLSKQSTSTTKYSVHILFFQ